MSLLHNLDTDLIVEQLRSKGHVVGHVTSIPENAGDFEFTVDGEVLTLAEVREVIAADRGGV